MLLAEKLISTEQQPVAILGINGPTAETVSSTATIAFDENFTGYNQVAGIASVLISSAAFATHQSSYIYSWINACGTGSSINEAVTSSMTAANLNIDQVTLLEVSALASDTQQQEVDGLLTAYTTENRLHTAISCARSVTGEGGGFSQLAGLLKTIICLHQHYIPGLKDWKTPATELERWQSSGFYFPTESRPWFPHTDDQPHIAAYSCLTDDNYCHLLLQENVPADKSTDIRHNGYLACSNLSLVILSFEQQQQLDEQLDAIEISCQKLIAEQPDTNNVRAIAEHYYQQYKNHRQLYCISLIAETAEELLKEVNLARVAVSKTLTNKTEWKTPRGSYFSAAPVAGENNIAFFYPGIGATYVGLGRDLFHLFPEIYQPVAALADDIGATMKDQLLNPRSVTALDSKQLKKRDSDLRNSLAHIAECGVAFACVFTKIFEQVFKVKADYSAGYSMGEVSMYAALGCWQQPGLMSARLAGSETFNQRLSGELSTLRTLWKIAPDNDGKIWETYSIRATLEQVTEAAKDEEKVFCTIINTADNLLIGGYPEACERVINNLGVRAMAMDMPNAIHSAPAQAEYNDMETLFTMDVTERINTKMFSSSCYLPIPHRSRAIANSIAKCLCDPVDFPRLINSLYDRGARIFIEMGPGRSLCSWTDKIIKQDPEKNHASLPVNAKGTMDELTYLRALAKLVSHGVSIDLDSVFNGSIIVNK